ncbi:adhesion G protein-coupled receptor L2-like isoform X6 [Eriocheir sinensis]|uniref:adhesion G protein-coupled receptor L2-like isoform X6 n=1 Tax=Eriocheir sinensis TaxID=95602 RepID=UPI0021CACA51|nr:adhesion G protein-coupled receptor L2-like isoform X6 [Eriocheir sinensis]
MDCDPGHVINLIRANYGRFSITICNEHGNTEWSVNCMSPRSHRVLHDKCSQRQNCSVAASTRGFGDPCPGTLKYLEAHFQCVPVNPPSHTARPRPPWFIATVSSITEDDPPLPSPPAKGGAAGAGVGTGTGVGGTQANDDRDAGDREIGGGRKEGAADDDDDSSLNLENRVNGTPIEDLPQTTTSTTTTLRPPPWLITNTTKNTTTSTTTTTTTTTTSTTAKPASSSTTTTAQPQTNLEAPSGSGGAAGEHGEGVSGDEASTSIGVKSPESPDSEQFPTSTVSTTTTWAPRAEVPSTGGGPVGSEASWCPPTSGRGLTWNWTQGGETAVQPCPGGASGWARRPCDSQGWAGAADLSECRSMWLSTLTSRAHTNDAVLAVAHDLASVTASRALYGGDVTATARLLNSLARRMANDVIDFPDVDQREAMVTELVNIAVATGSNLVGGQQAAWADLRPLEHRAAATSLLLGLEEAAFLLANNLHHEKTVRHAEANILLRLQVMETRNVESVTFPSAGEMWLTDKPTPSSDPASTPTGYGPFTTTGEQDASQPYPSEDILQDLDGETYKIPQDTITLPPEALLENSENGLVKMVFFSYDGLHHLLQPARRTYTPSEANFKGVNETRVLNSRVLSASLGAGRHIELSEPVVLTFAMLRTVNVTNPACVFWDYTTSSWSEEGCRVLRYNTSHTICQCDHLTNFAVLMDIHATPMSYPHHLALSIITYVGCVISIVCLLLATIVFHAFRGLKSDRTTIHKNLCVCLLIAETVFLAGINQTDKPVVCGVVAGLLHFFFLAAFVWMFMEGFQLYVMLVEVFEAEKPRARWYYAAAYGFPAVVVAVSAVVDPFSYGTTEVCWLRTDNYFIFAFVGPVIAVIIANSVFLSMSLFIMCRHANLSSSLKNKEHTKLASVRGRHENALFAKIKNHVTWVRGAVVFMFLLSLTWAFGLLYLNHASMVMAYVFTIFNSLQGIFIFIFHCIQNDKVKKELRRAGRRHPWLRACLCAAADRSQASKDTRSSSHNVGSHSQPNSHASHTKYSFKSCGRDSGHGGSEQEDSPRTGPTPKLSSLRLNNNVVPHLTQDHLVNPFSTANSSTTPAGDSINGNGHNQPTSGPEALLPDYHLAGDAPTLRLPCSTTASRGHRTHSPWNHTYTEIPDGVAAARQAPLENGSDPVYEEIEREGRSELQVSDLSDEDGRRHSSDISRQSSRSYGDHRPLLPYTLPDRHSAPHQHQPQYDPRLKGRMRHQDIMDNPHNHTLPGNRLGLGGQLDHTIVSPGHILPMTHAAVTSAHAIPHGNGHIASHQYMDGGPHLVNSGQLIDSVPQYSQAMLATLGHSLPVVHPLSEPNLRNWEAAQRHRDLQQLQQLGEMTVAVLSGEQVVCKLKPPLAPIDENTGTAQVERHPPPPTYSHC